MPHKHKRKHDDDNANFDLPPTSRAKPLPTDKVPLTKDGGSRKRRKGGANKEVDDTPKSFARLMAFQTTGRRIPSGLDDGIRRKKKQRGAKDGSKPVTGVRDGKTGVDSKPNTTTNESAEQEEVKDVPEDEKTTESVKPNSIPPSLKILPGERLSDFALRVDQSLPLSSASKTTTITNPNNPNAPLVVKANLTKHNKRLARMQAEWRNTEARLRDKREDEVADLLDEKEEHDLLWLDVDAARTNKKGKKRKGAANGLQSSLEDDGDPWKILQKKRKDEGTEVRQRNLQDVVTAPPVLKPIKNIFKGR